MTARISIGEMMKAVRREVQANAAHLARGAVIAWLEANRSELLAAITQAQYERGAALLETLCKRFPWLAGGVTLAMKGSPKMAIAAIAVYDSELAAQLARHEEQFAELQAYWHRGRETESG